ncbi:MAG TPA: adenylosuccinate synthetase, partial [Methylomirabilota bacterium]
YRRGSDVLTEFPADLGLLTGCQPVYERWEGWSAPTRGVRRYEELPDAARAYVRRLEEVTGVPVAIVSTGSDRDETLIRPDSPLADWLA